MNEIPAITDPLGRHWRQPQREEILIDNTHSLMSESHFRELHEYSASLPSGTYEGKMWKCNRAGVWYLAWYCPAPDCPGQIGIQWRILLTV